MQGIEYMSAKQSNLLRKFLKEVCALEAKISEVECELQEASGENIRVLAEERRKAEAEGLRVSDTPKAVLAWRTVSGYQSSEGEAGLSSVSSAGCSWCERSRQTRRSMSRAS